MSKTTTTKKKLNEGLVRRMMQLSKLDSDSFIKENYSVTIKEEDDEYPEESEGLPNDIDADEPEESGVMDDEMPEMPPEGLEGPTEVTPEEAVEVAVQGAVEGAIEAVGAELGLEVDVSVDGVAGGGLEDEMPLDPEMEMPDEPLDEMPPEADEMPGEEPEEDVMPLTEAQLKEVTKRVVELLLQKKKGA